MAPPCIDLRERFGGKFRITWDPAFDARGKHRENLDPWYAQIPCRCGVIYSQGGNILALEVDHHPRVAKELAALGLPVWQNGEHEKTFLFPVERFDEVATIVKPRKRRRLSAEHKAKLAAAGGAALERFRCQSSNSQSS